MSLLEPPRPAPLSRTLGLVWIVAGGVAVVAGLLAGVGAISVFGLFAAAVGAVMMGFSRLKEKSRSRTARTLSGDPPPPSAAPFAAPAEPDDDLDLDDRPEPVVRIRRTESDGDDAGTGAPGATRSDARVSASEVEDGTGDPVQRDRPR